MLDAPADESSPIAGDPDIAYTRENPNFLIGLFMRLKAIVVKFAQLAVGIKCAWNDKRAGRLKSITSRNITLPYYRQRSLYSLSLRKFVNTASPILVYQMGHVGSTSVYRSLKPSITDRPIFHTHSVSETGVAGYYARVDWQRREYGLELARSKSTTKLAYIHFLREYLQRSNVRPRVVTLVRDPIARAVSSVYYADGRNALSLADPNTPWKQRSRTTLDLIDRGANDMHQMLSSWFDNELNREFGIDVFDEPFTRRDRERGYKTYESPKADALLIRLEDLDRCASTAFQEFLDVDGITIVDANRSQGKPYYESYRRFTREVELPRTYVDRMLGISFASHFYSPEEIQAFRTRWTTATYEPVALEGLSGG